MKKFETVIFYSWQSDLPKETNLNALRINIRSVIKELAKKDYSFLLDEATRDVPGSPDIPLTILRKISSANIFIADITTINQYSLGARKVGNPNVLIELGYAVAELGWDRIILVFNSSFGKMPEDVPFDIDRKRILEYKIENKEDSKGFIDLFHKLKEAIKLILKHNPSYPFENRLIDPALKKKEHDTLKLTFLFSYIHIPSIDLFLTDVLSSFHVRIFHFYESFKSIITGAGFYLYDNKAMKILNKILKHWTILLSMDALYHETSNHEVQKFGLLYGQRPTENESKQYLTLEKSAKRFRILFPQLISHIKENYLDIDTNELSKQAFFEWEEFMKN